MNLIENFGNVMEKARAMTALQIKGWKNFLFFLVAIDLFGVYYFLKLKSLGIALLFVIIVALAFILYLERDLPSPKPKTKPIKSSGGIKMDYKKEYLKLKEKKEKKINYKEEYLKLKDRKEENNEEEVIEEPRTEEKDGFNMGFDTGLPDPDEYQKRMRDSMGTL